MGEQVGNGGIEKAVGVHVVDISRLNHLHDGIKLGIGIPTVGHREENLPEPHAPDERYSDSQRHPHRRILYSVIHLKF